LGFKIPFEWCSSQLPIEIDGALPIVPSNCPAIVDLVLKDSLGIELFTIDGNTPLYVLPDVTHTDSDLSSVILPAQTPMVCTPSADATETLNGVSVASIPSGGNKNIVFRNTDLVNVGTVITDTATDLIVEVPVVVALERIYLRPSPTGQTTSYALYDDYWQQVNNPYPAHPTDPTHTAALTDFFTLALNNKHGNLNRFTDVNGLQVYADDYIEDHYRGLGILRTVKQDTWVNAISLSQSSTELGFTNWRLPNQNEQFGMTNLSLKASYNYTPLNIPLTAFTVFQSSTTVAGSTSNYWRVAANANAWKTAKNQSQRYIIIRNF
jgi:hypothetical protein